MANDGVAQPKKSGCGGCFKGCAAGCLTVLVLLGVGGFLIGRNVKGYLLKLTTEYADTVPAPLPKVQVSEEEQAALFQRVELFTKALADGVPVQDLTLSAQDINVLIQKNPGWSKMADKVYVTINGDAIRGDASIPLGELNAMFKDRWLNGSGTFKVEMAAGRLLVFMDELSVRGKEVPDAFMKGLRGKNLAEKAYTNPQSAAVMERLESIVVRDGKLHIRAKGSLTRRPDNQ